MCINRTQFSDKSGKCMLFSKNIECMYAYVPNGYYFQTSETSENVSIQTSFQISEKIYRVSLVYIIPMDS